MDVIQQNRLNVNLKQINIVIGDESFFVPQEMTLKDIVSPSHKVKTVSEAFDTIKKIRQQLTQKTPQQRNQMMSALNPRQAFSFLA